MYKITTLRSIYLFYLSQIIFLLLSSCSGKNFHGKGIKRPLDEPQFPPSKKRKLALNEIESERSISKNELDEPQLPPSEKRKLALNEIDSARSISKNELDEPQFPPSKKRKLSLNEIELTRYMSKNGLNELLLNSKASEKAVFFNKVINKQGFITDLLVYNTEIFEIFYDNDLPMENLIQEIFCTLLVDIPGLVKKIKPNFIKKIFSNNHFMINKYDEMPFFLKDLTKLSNSIRDVRSIVSTENCFKYFLPIFKKPLYVETKKVLLNHNLDYNSTDIILGYIYPKNFPRLFGNIFNFYAEKEFLEKYNNEEALKQVKEKTTLNQITNKLKFHNYCQTFQKKTITYICKKVPFLCSLFEHLQNSVNIEFFVKELLLVCIEKEDYYIPLITLKYLSTNLKKNIFDQPLYHENKKKMYKFAFDFFKNCILNNEYEEGAIFLLNLPEPLKEELVNKKIEKNDELLTPVELFCLDNQWDVDTSILDTLLPKNLDKIYANLVDIAFENSICNLYLKLDLNESYPMRTQVKELVEVIQNKYEESKLSGDGTLESIYNTEIIKLVVHGVQLDKTISLKEKLQCLFSLQGCQNEVDLKEYMNELLNELMDQKKNSKV